MESQFKECVFVTKSTCNQSTQTEEIIDTINHNGIKHPIKYTFDKRICLEIATVENPKERTNYLLDTGAQLNIITAKQAKKVGATYVNTSDTQGIRGVANSEYTWSIGSTWVHLKIGEYIIPTKFHVINKLAIPAILGAGFIKKHIHSIGDNFEYGIFQLNTRKKTTLHG